jgi:hypothetical protein
MVPWRFVHLRTDHVNISIHIFCLLNEPSPVTFRPCDIITHYDPYRYFLPNPGSSWTFCQTWHDLCHLLPALWHRAQPSLKINVDIFTWFLGTFLTSSRLSGDMLISGHIYDEQPSVKWNVDVLSLWFFDTFMSNRLLSKLRTFCHMNFGHSCDVQPLWLSKKIWTLCHMNFGHICDVQLVTKWNKTIQVTFYFIMSGRNVTAKLDKKYKNEMTQTLEYLGTVGRSATVSKTVHLFEIRMSVFGWTCNPSTLSRNVTVVLSQ